ncbi:MAG TPA: hypothetical protein VL947_11805, partial [Cytophagales bacterium]|nr:hypothetical protein [Cytophagales bacterium]
MKHVLFILLLVLGRVTASHIVGGELSLQQVDKGGGTYEISLTFLFDDVNGNPNSEGAVYPIRSFRKSDHTPIQQFYLRRYRNTEILKYSDSLCINGEVSTRIIRYRDTVTLSVDLYNVPVYFATEVCCRNGRVSNIENSGNAGYVFYAEFPALKDKGLRVNNSSPQFNKLRGDYACVGKETTLDFSAQDRDGDSLVYTLMTPLNGHASSVPPNSALPDPVNPGPYMPVSWIAGSDSVNLPGAGYIRIHPATGLLTIRTSYSGFYICSVQCAEYRNGNKIGEVRRDYQIWVDNCPSLSKPILTRGPGIDSLFTIRDLQTAYAIVARDSSQRLYINYQALNFNPVMIKTTNTSKFVVNRQDSLLSSFSWADCRLLDTAYTYKMRVVVSNQACPIPFRDTLMFNFKVSIPQNTPPITAVVGPQERWLTIGDNADSLYIRSVNTDSARINLEQFTDVATVNGTWNVAPFGF